MATYVVTNSEEDDYESGRRFKTRSEADAFFAQEKAQGNFVRLIRWDWVAPETGEPKELARFHGARK